MRRFSIGLISLICLIGPIGLHADVTVPSSVDANDTWSPENGIYILNSRVTVPAGVTLTISPGTVVKGFGDIFVNGSLQAAGTADNPITFTSLRDDDVSGDTNNDGTSTVPAVGDWNGLIFSNGSTGSVSYVRITYAGNSGIGMAFSGIRNEGGNVNLSHSVLDHDGNFPFYNHLGSFTVDNSEMRSGVVGALIESGSGAISNSVFNGNSQYGLQDSSTNSLALTGNIFSDNNKTAAVDATVDFTHSNNTSSDRANRGFQISGSLGGNYTFSSTDLPIIVLGQLTVPIGKTLTISPGTVMKFGPGVGLSIDGSLSAPGTVSSPIKFTSIKDDSIGGDTNGDESASSPTPNNSSDNWTGIQINSGGQGTISNAELWYGGTHGPVGNEGALVYNFGGVLNLDKVSIKKSFEDGIYHASGTTTAADLTITDNNQHGIKNLNEGLSLSNSIIRTNNGSGVTNGGSAVLDLRNNWWGSADGPHDPAGTSTGSGDWVFGNVLYTPWLISEPVFDVATSSDSGGSSGTSTSSTLYGTSTPVIIVPGILGSAEQDGVWVIDPILHTYDNLIETLEANGYTMGVNLFTFPYDWRASNVATAGLLKLKIDEVKNICHCSKVNIIAHSMGGLAAQYYAESPGYENDINQLIFLGTPHRGSPKDYLAWEAGETTPDLISSVSSLFFGHQAHENGYINTFSYIRNFPISSIEQLLPIDSYLKLASTGFFKLYPTSYPRNVFLESLNNNLSTLLNSGIKIKNYIGDTGTTTISIIRVTDTPNPLFWADGYPEDFAGHFGDHGLENGRGDGTVPVSSASLSTTTDVVISAGHGQLPTELSTNIFADLVGTTTDTRVNRSVISRVLMAQIFSPADIEIIAPDGKKVGWDPDTGQYINEIPGAFFTGTNNEEEYITIPDPIDGAYQVNAIGKAAGGSYILRTSSISDSSEQTVEHNGAIAAGQVLATNVALSGDSVSAPSDVSDLSVSSVGSVPGTVRHGVATTVRKPAFVPIPLVPTSTLALKAAPRASKLVAPSAGLSNTAAVYNAVSPQTKSVLGKVGKWIAGFFKRLFGSKIK